MLCWGCREWYPSVLSTVYSMRLQKLLSFVFCQTSTVSLYSSLPFFVVCYILFLCHLPYPCLADLNKICFDACGFLYLVLGIFFRYSTDFCALNICKFEFLVCKCIFYTLFYLILYNTFLYIESL